MMKPFVINCNLAISLGPSRAKLALSNEIINSLSMLSRYLKKTKYLTIVPLLTAAFAANAAEKDSAVNSGDQVIGEWQFALGVGVGKKQSVIYDQDDRSLYLLPSVKYYGEKLFFDNGTLGYTLYENNDHALSIAAELNPLLAQFKQFHPDNIFSPESVSDSINSPAVSDADEPVTVEDSEDEFGAEDVGKDVGPTQELEDVKLNELDWSIDLGLQHNWFVTEQISVINQVFYDVSSVHSGHRIKSSISWSLPTISSGNELAKWRLNLETGLHYLDRESTQYYFGVDDRDTDDSRVYYQTEAALNYHIAITAVRPISEKINLILFYRFEQLDNNLKASPIVTDDHVMTYFAGITYDF